ncbi:MAG: hypothetical protein IEMM0001_2298 [bacterium]|nr:MAG: hypothetical protein IEMM0001_2298 [bacterium]
MNEQNTYIVSDLSLPNESETIAETAPTQISVRLVNVIVDEAFIDNPNKIVRAEYK